MKNFCTKILSALFLSLISVAVLASEKLVQLELGRGSATMPIYVMSNSSAKSTLILFPGGDADIGKTLFGKPGSNNFLSRTRDIFQAEGFNVVVAYRPTDMSDLDTDYRISKQHIDEIEKVITYSKKEFNVPVWLVGTSRGTVSVTAAAIGLGDVPIEGIVLTSSVTAKKHNGVISQEIALIKVPVLVIHHQNDECKICVPADASKIVGRLASSPVSKYIEVIGGYSPSGNPCEAKHWHGFINYEKETVKLITDWVKNPIK
jgi:pimeloyl-ACP methyl ester carboxylesterase